VNPTLIKAVIVVTFALLFYSVAVITEQRRKALSRRIIYILTAGLVCDISSTALMIVGSRRIPITIHGFLGYSALILMLLDTILIWRYWIKNRRSADSAVKVPKSLHLYTRVAYGWWVIAYIAGAVIAIVIEN
jgi:uncharacterized repeat protein (TIGR03987 family)